jgi:thiamine-phosphate pyrophosphorylase
MDAGLLAWGRRVKRRRHGKIPPLWFFTDAARLADPLPVVAMLPRGLSGVVFRHDDAPDRLALGRRVAALCRARRLALVVAGDARLAARLRAGLHLRGGQRGVLKPPRLVTASAHDAAQLLRARRAGAGLIFCSPVHVTKSHAGAPVLGPAGWRRLARLARGTSVAALGGITGRTIRTLGTTPAAAGAIEAFFPQAGTMNSG